MTKSRIITGLEKDRFLLRSAALRIIREIVEQPLSRLSSVPRKDILVPPKLSAFKRLEPIGFGLDDDDTWFFAPEDCPPDLVWPLNVGLVLDKKDVGMADEGDPGLILHKVYSISPRDYRGVIHKFSPFMVRMDHAQTFGGKMYSFSAIMAWLGKQWISACADPKDGVTPSFSRMQCCIRDDAKTAMASAVALRQRYEWSVSLGLEHSPSIRFATDPTGVKDIFRIRDLPEGRDRREPLLSWVLDHWRQARNDPDMETYVRKHLRGAVNFSWQGLDVELTPSQFDVDQRDRLIAEREAMRARGEDKRRKSNP